MSARLPDPERSRAVVIGAGTGHAGLDLPRLPELGGLLTRLRARLAGTVAEPVLLANPRSVTRLRTAVRKAAAEATDLLLVYCAGHVLPDQDGRPRLVLAGTVPGDLAATAFALDDLTAFLATSPAVTKVLLLDCGGWTVALPDAYTLASGRPRTPRTPSTAFTAAVLAALDNPDPPSFMKLRSRIDQELLRRDEPKVQAKAAAVVLLRGFRDGQPVSDEPGDPPDSPPRRPVLVGTAPAAVRRRPFRANRSGVCTLLRLDEDKIVLHRLAADPVGIPWADVVTIGLLPPNARVGGSGDRGRDHVLAVKPRNDVIGALRRRLPQAPRLVRDMDEVGLVGLAMVGDLGVTTHQLLSRLAEFAQDRAAHSNRDWITRHPELRGALSR